jgi:hypothetical protein
MLVARFKDKLTMKTICDLQIVDGEIQYCQKTFRQNGYSVVNIHQAFIPIQTKEGSWGDHHNLYAAPYDKIRRYLVRFSIGTAYNVAKKNIHVLSFIVYLAMLSQ